MMEGAKLEDGAAGVGSHEDCEGLGTFVHKAATGRLKACIFLFGYVLVERTVYYGIAGNLVSYLKTVLHLDIASSAKYVTTWLGVTNMCSLLGAFVADAYWGRQRTIRSCIPVYLTGLVFLTLSATLPPLKPPQCFLRDPTCPKASFGQLGLFFMSIFFISIGTGGNGCLQAFVGDQFDDEDESEKVQKASAFNWLFFAVNSGSLIAFSLIIFLEDKVGWPSAFSTLTAAMGIGVLLLLNGGRFYREKLLRPPPGSDPITRLLQVWVAAIRKCKLTAPLNHDDLYELHEKEDESRKQSHNPYKLSHTSNLRFLDKGAILDSSDKSAIASNILPSAWRLCTLTQVEEAKLVIAVVPIWMCCFMYGIQASQTFTFFIKQGSKMNTRLGLFKIPPASLQCVALFTSLLVIPIYDRLFVPFARRLTGNIRGLTMLQRIGTGLLTGCLVMVFAALTETKRLKVATEHNLLDDFLTPVPVSILILLPQYICIGIANVFTMVGLQEFLYDQLPTSMRSIGVAMYLAAAGIGVLLSSVIITIITDITGHGQLNEGWIQDNLNRAHLDKYYWALAGISFINLAIYVLMAIRYTYKQQKALPKPTPSFDN